CALDIVTSICSCVRLSVSCFFCSFNETTSTESYTLSLHDALPICSPWSRAMWRKEKMPGKSRRVYDHSMIRNHSGAPTQPHHALDRKSTRLNSSHGSISYAVFCLKKKK